MNLEIANRLVRLRKENHLSQEELAEKIGISRQAVSKWERAEASPDTDNLILLARLYGIALDELLKTDGPVGSQEDQQQEAPREPVPPMDGEGENGRESFLLRFPYPILVTILYLIVGFCFDRWHPGWILFVTIPIYYWIAEEISRWNRRN